MPELPEVETTRRGIEPFVLDKTVERVVVREPRLRWPVPDDLALSLENRRVTGLRRRSKYLLLDTARGSAIVHLGMSGSLRVVTARTAPRRHDHVDIVMRGGAAIRFHDPRRFGCLLWTADDPLAHPLLKSLGPEPFSAGFSGEYLHRRSRGRTLAVKNFIMDTRVVAGVGNIYACEALAGARIHPLRAAGRVSLARYRLLAARIRDTLNRSIRLGGTTLRDFVDPNGEPGYFEQTLLVYGRGGEPCRACGASIRHVVSGQRSSFYCGRCQR